MPFTFAYMLKLRASTNPGSNFFVSPGGGLFPFSYSISTHTVFESIDTAKKRPFTVAPLTSRSPALVCTVQEVVMGREFIILRWNEVIVNIVNVTAAARCPRHPSEGYLRGDLVSVGHQPHPAHARLAHGNPRGLCGFRPPCEVVKGDRFPEIAEVANCVFFR